MNATNPAIRVRSLLCSDLNFAGELRRLARWNQTEQDWKRFLEYDPAGCFLAEWEETPAGTAMIVPYPSQPHSLAWIGMVLVHPDRRRIGIGRQLLLHCLEAGRARAFSCIKLDATPLGQPLYQSLGFRDEWNLNRWECPAIDPAKTEDAPALPNPTSSDLVDIAHLDQTAFGTPRPALLNLLTRDSSAAVLVRSANGTLQGFGLLRPGSRAQYLGPIAAQTAAAAQQIILSLLKSAAGKPVYWDIPEPNPAAEELAQNLKFTRQRPLIRMHLGTNHAPGNPTLYYGIADPAVG